MEGNRPSAEAVPGGLSPVPARVVVARRDGCLWQRGTHGVVRAVNSIPLMDGQSRVVNLVVMSNGRVVELTDEEIERGFLVLHAGSAAQNQPSPFGQRS